MERMSQLPQVLAIRAHETGSHGLARGQSATRLGLMRLSMAPSSREEVKVRLTAEGEGKSERRSAPEGNRERRGEREDGL